jgi:hypothetical protein
VAKSSKERRVNPVCSICGSREAIAIDHRPYVPILQNRVWQDRAAARAAPLGELDMRLCAACGFAWNRTFDADAMIYDPEYDNDQMGSPSFGAHVGRMVERVLASVPPDTDTHLVEVGCGQGAFLRKLALTKRFASLTGFDPAFRGEDGACIAGVTIHKRLFGPGALGLLTHAVQVVVSRHTIEHIFRPLDFLSTIRAAIETTPEARLFLETPDIEWILDKFQPQDLFYEHCSIFSPEALRVACSAAGFEIGSLVSVFGDQYLWVEARPVRGASRITVKSSFAAAAETFGTKRDRFITYWRLLVARLAVETAVWIWGASSKGVTFALLIDPDGKQLTGAIDINPNKVGRFMPVTGLPIRGPERLNDGDVVIVMNSNYREEIIAQIDAQNISVRLMTLDDLPKQELSA